MFNLFNLIVKIMTSGIKILLLQIIDQSCDILEDAIARYREIILEESRLADKLFRYKNMSNSVNDSLSVDKLSRLKVYLKRPCEHYPHVKSDESC